MVITEHLTDDLGALTVRRSRRQVETPHRIEDPPMHRLQSVASVGNGAPDDHAHGVVQVGRTHFVLDTYGDLLGAVAVGMIRGARGSVVGHEESTPSLPNNPLSDKL